MPKLKMLTLAAAVLLASSPLTYAAKEDANDQKEMLVLMKQMNTRMAQLEGQVTQLQNKVVYLQGRLKTAENKKGKNVIIAANKDVRTQSDVNNTAVIQTKTASKIPIKWIASKSNLSETSHKTSYVAVAPSSADNLNYTEQVASTEDTLSEDWQPTQALPLPSVSRAISVLGLPVFSSPYISLDRAYDGSDLIVNQSSVNLDVHLLEQRKVIERLLAQYDISVEQHPWIELGGKIEVQAAQSHNATIDLTGTELDTFIILNKCVTGLMTFNYDNSFFSPNRPSNSRLFVRQAFLIIGNLTHSPWYVTTGQFYVPFGQYGTYFPIATQTQLLGRTRARAVALGYRPGEGLFGSVYTFRGATSGNNHTGAGINLGFSSKFMKTGHANIAVGVISNIAESEGFLSNGAPAIIPFQGFGVAFGPENLRTNGAPGFDINGSIDLGKYSVIGEYVTATRAFNPWDLSINGAGARPSAYHMELVRHFRIHGKPGTYGVGADFTSDALALWLPKRSIEAVFNISPWADTLLSFEYQYAVNYDSANFATGGGIPIVFRPVGDRIVNTALVQFGIYF
ncbi:MAG: LbtU family siderophore porin [Gammaproteobacteria bacterium]